MDTADGRQTKREISLTYKLLILFSNCKPVMEIENRKRGYQANKNELDVSSYITMANGVYERFCQMQNTDGE